MPKRFRGLSILSSRWKAALANGTRSVPATIRVEWRAHGHGPLSKIERFANPMNDQVLRDNLAHDGFVAIRGFLDGKQLSELEANLERFIADVVPDLPPDHVFYEDKEDRSTLKQIQCLGDHDHWFADLFEASGFRHVAEVLLERPAVPKNLQYFNKPPLVGRATPPHQDGYYFMLSPCEAVTMWLALDDVDEENGCVRYGRGSHRTGMREHARTQTLGFSQGIAGYPTDDDREREVAIPANRGDLLVHHALTIHRADGNRSTVRTRRALGFVYYSDRAREDADTHRVYQERLSREMREDGMI